MKSRRSATLLTVSGAARRLGVHVNTVRAWSDKGRLSCLRINDRGDRRYLPEELDRFLSAAASTRSALAEVDAPPTATAAAGAAPTTSAHRADDPADDRPSYVSRRGTDDASVPPPPTDALAVLDAVSLAGGRHFDDDAELVAAVAEALARSAGYSAATWVGSDGSIRPIRGRLAADTVLAQAALRRRRPVRGASRGQPAERILAVPAAILAVPAATAATPASGALLVERPDPGRLPVRDELALLSAVGAQLGAALAASAGRRELAEQRLRYEMLLAVGGDIASELDLPRSLSQLTDHARELFGADHAAIFRRLPMGGFVADAVRDLTPRFIERVEHAPRLPLIMQAFDEGETVSVVDYPNDPRAAGMREALLAEGIDTVTVAPLISDGEPLGVLGLYHDRPYHWTSEGLATLRLLARQGAVAVKNASNYGQMATWAAQLQSIQQLGARLTRLTSVTDIGQAIAAELHQLIDYHNVRVYRVQGDDVIPVAWRGEVGEYVGEDGEQLRVRVGQGITGWVARHGLAQNLGDAAADRRTETIPGTEDDLPESLLLAPMLFEDQVIGVIVLAKLGLNQFTADDLRLLEIYASIAAQAMVNADATEQLRAQSATLEQQLKSQRELLRVTESILGTLDTQAVLQEIAARLGALLEADNIGVDIYDETARLLRPIFAQGVHAAAYLGRTIGDDQGVGGHVVRTGEAVLVQDELADDRVAHFEDLGPVPGALIVAPLRARDRVTGVLTIERLGAEARFSDEEFELIKLFAGHVSIALQNAATHRAVEIRAQTDALTGLMNQGSLNLHLERAVALGEPFALLMADLDDFKRFNDTRGHQAGSVMLERLGGLLRAACRDSDVVFRYGGDEFAILLPQTTAAGAVGVAAKVAAAVSSVTDGRRPVIRITTSIGVACYPTDGHDGASILLAADRACYAAKRKGRDRIATAAEGLELAPEFLPATTPVDAPDSAYSAA